MAPVTWAQQLKVQDFPRRRIGWETGGVDLERLKMCVRVMVQKMTGAALLKTAALEHDKPQSPATLLEGSADDTAL